MPNCFQLTRKTELEKGPVALNQIDQEMCEHFGVPCHPDLYHKEWYTVIGMPLAFGCDFATIKARFPTHANIVDWLDANFTPDAFYTPRSMLND